jgi:hypothetical protein
MKTLNPTLAITFFSVLLMACSGGGGGGSVSTGSNTAEVSFGISDATIDDAKQVVIEIEAMTFRRPDQDDIVLETFSSDALDLDDAENFQINLMDYQGDDSVIVVDLIELPVGDYSQLILAINDEDINRSYVIETDDDQRDIKVPSDTLKLDGFTVNNSGVQSFVIEFDIRKSMAYRPGPQVYNLKPRGVRIVSNGAAAALRGTVDDALFNSPPDCTGKFDPEAGNVVYLYRGHNLDSNKLSDMYDPNHDSHGAPADAIEPYAADSVDFEDDLVAWEYEFGYLPAGNYTLAFSCAALGDDSEGYDGIAIPSPADQIIELTLSEGQTSQCDLPIVAGSCSN